MNARKTTLAMVLGMMVAGGSWAATDGDLGDTSTGSLELDLQVGDPDDPTSGSILIQNLGDIDLGRFFEEGNDLSGVSNFCVYRVGHPEGFDFSLTPTSTQGTVDNAFKLKADGVTQSIGYQVRFKGAEDADDTSPLLTHGSAYDAVATSSVGLDQDLNCDGENVSLFVQASVVDASVAPAAEYGDTLTLMVEAR